MPQFNFQVSSAAPGYPGDWLPIVLPIVLVLWLATIWSILHRSNSDPVTRLTWIVVVIFVPFFGMVMYWFSSAPSTLPKPAQPPTGSDLSGTPWAEDSNFRLPRK